MSSNANIERVYYNLYDASGNQIWSDWPYWNTSTEQIVLNEDFYLTSGTYYLSIQRYGGNDGSYTFKASFVNAGESFKEPQEGNNNSMAAADNISVGSQYKGQIAMNDDRDFYKFTLSTSGTLNLSSTAGIERVYYKLFDASGNEIWSEWPYWNTSSEQIVLDEDLCLTSGTYYLEFQQYGSNCGNYVFRTSFATAGESFKESQGGSDNSMSSARTIGLNTTYKGQLAINDEKDFYKFTLSTADTLEVSATAVNIERLYYKIFDVNGNEIWSEWPYWDSSTKKNVINESVELQAGTYYFEVEKYYSSSNGNYFFSLASDRNVANPSAVSGLRIGGRAGDALRLNWNKAANASGYIVEQYKNGSWTRIARIGSANTLTYRVSGLNPSTTYQFRVKSFGYRGSTPIYSGYKYINGKTNPSIISGLKIGGRATDALRLNWSRNSKASGYIVEQYKGGKWTRIARIGNNSTVTYRIAGLSSATTYQFRVQAFSYDGSTPIYGAYKTISGKTLPTAVTGLKIGGRATDALRLNWSRNSTASGYIIDQYNGGNWTRIARIGNNSTVTYRIAGLSASTTYQFRIKAFGFSGNTPLYSSYKTISGKTLPTAVTGLRIGGTAPDALRLNWNRNSKASGYIVEQFKNNTWVRIARIGTNSTVTYRVENLRPGMAYVFRVRSFSFDGSTALYSSYQYISGVTNR